MATFPSTSTGIPVDNDAKTPSDAPTKIGIGDQESTISVIVPLHGGGSASRRCLLGLHSAAPAADEVIVVVDGWADDETIELARQLGMSVLKLEPRGGPAQARNHGAAAARGEILLFIDSDVEVMRGTIGQVARCFGQRPGVAAIIGSYDDSPSDPGFLSQYRNLLHHYVHQNAHEEGSTFWGACGGIRRRVFFELGGFDEGYDIPCIEDIELGQRLKQSGHRIALIKTIQVKHLKRWAAFSMLQTDLFRRALPWTQLILRTGQLQDDLNTDRASRIKVMFAFSSILMIGLGLATGQVAVGGSIGLLFLLALLTADRRLLSFFRAKRGYRFALQAIPWLLTFYIYSGIGFLMGVLAHYLGRAGRARMFSGIGAKFLLANSTTK